ncbi:MAG: family 78 glycoside hydrolase catalytic domain [Myxococcales bacterium]
MSDPERVRLHHRLALAFALTHLVGVACAGNATKSQPTGTGGRPGNTAGGGGDALGSGGSGAGAGGDRGASGGMTADGSDGSAGRDSSGGAGVPDGGSQPDGATGGAAPPGDASVVAGAIMPQRLRCELRDAPLGIQTPTPRLSWELAAAGSSARGLSQTAYEVLVATSPDALAMGQGDLLATGVVASGEQRLVYAGKALGSLAHVYWKVRIRDQSGAMSGWSAVAEFTVGLLAAADWSAQWITGASSGALPLFRKDFTVDKPVRRALLAICGLGQHEVHVNGTNASKAVMEPAWTNYAKTCDYVIYDVTSSLAQGPNALGVMLGNGMYNVEKNSRYTKFTGSFGAPKLILRLAIDFMDGTSATVASDTSWKTAPGPITFTNIYGGEDFDAAKEPAGWDKAGFAASGWASATVATGTAPALVAAAAPPVKVMQTFTSTKVTQPSAGVFVYDLGQNFSGWPVLEVQGSAGASVTIRTGELLSGGVVSQRNSGSPVYFTYTLKGGGPESWHPRFAYTGFRYVQVEGAVPMAMAASFPGRPQITAVSGQFIYSSAESVGQFTSSDQDLTRIHALVLAAFRSNLQNVLTDCPHREKLGWLESSQLLAPGIMFNHDVASFYEKIIDDMRDAQTASGLVPTIAPEYTIFDPPFRDSPEWGSAYIIDPWHVYQMYGDDQPLVANYANMKRYQAYLASKAAGNIITFGLGDWYDVGPAAPGNSQLTSAGVTATATWLQDVEVLRQSALVLKNATDAAQFAATATTVTSAFNSKFLNANGTYDRNSQTDDAMPLALNLVPDAQKAMVLNSLVAAITAAKNRVTAGDVGFVYVLRALMQAGRSDVIYGIAKQSAGPGYLYQLSKGATTLTEAWDANPSSSQNHAMLGDIEEWFYTGLGGISPASPGWKQITIRPQIPAGLDSVNVQYHSVRGIVASNWQRGAGGLTLSVTIPVNTTATVTIPTANPAAVTEGGAPAQSAPGVMSMSSSASALVLVLGSGQYRFVAP